MFNIEIYVNKSDPLVLKNHFYYNVPQKSQIILVSNVFVITNKKNVPNHITEMIF
jgi:hypothetical protein